MKMRNRIIRLNPEKQFRDMIIYLLMMQSIYFCISSGGCITESEMLKSINSLHLYLFLYVWLFLCVMLNKQKKVNIVEIMYATFWIVGVLLGGLCERNIWGLQHNNYLLWILGTSIPGFYIITNVQEIDKLNNSLVNLSRFFSVITIVLYYVSLPFVANRYSPEHYMFFSSGAAILASIELVSYLENKQKIDLVLAIILTVSILTGGARGGLVQVIAAWLIYLCVKKNYKMLAISVLTITGIYVLLLFFSDWLLQFEAIRSSRTLLILLKGSFYDSSGRDVFYRRAMEYFGEQHAFTQLFGLGIGGERKFIAQNLIEVGYVHQIFLELILHFGYIGGIVAILILIILSTMGLHFMSSKENYVLLGTVIFSSTIPLLVSGSYASSIFFHLWIGFCVRALLDRKRDVKLRKVAK